MNEKVTVRFESTMDSPNSEPLLLSGPVQIFASVDCLRDLRDEKGKLILDENGEVLKAGLDNKELIKAIKDADDVPQIIVFVNEVGDVSLESQKNRGAYFLYIGDRESNSLDCIVERDWQEILLGTHSHENIEQLNSLSQLSYSEKSGDKLVAIDETGKFKLVDNVELPVLPPLPAEFANRIKELEDYKKLHEPEENEWHHLDASLDELSDTYDWLRKDKNGNYTNLAVGNCRELYHSLIKSDKQLYLTNDGKLQRNNGDSSLALEIYEVNFDTDVYADCENTTKDSTNANRIILKLNLPLIANSDDKIILFADGKIISLNQDYEITSLNKSEIIIKFNRKSFEKRIYELTVLISRGSISAIDLYSLFVDEKIKLNEINNELIKLYIEGEFNRKPQVPQLYLTTDQYGNIHWDNKLLPTQYFYKKSIVINSKNVGQYYDYKLGKIKLVFEDAFFNINNNDFPILLADQYFAFDVAYDAELTNESKKDLVYLLDKDSRYLDWSDDDEIIAESTTFTLIIIKNSANGSLADEIADRYVSKEDAVKILSHGKINLKDYAKATDLIGFSRIGHVHTEYALRNHDHDYRYANYHHTHPELAAILATATGVNPSDCETWIDKLTGGILNLVNEVEDRLKTRNSLKDFNISPTTEIIDLINHKIEKDGYDIEKLTYESTLKEVLQYIIKFFELEYVYADQVVLPQDMVVTNKIGGTQKKYNKNTSLFDIVRDMLNPLVSAEEIKKKVTPDPDKTKIEYYRLDSMGNPLKIEDPLKIKSWVTNEGILLFKVLLRNSDGEECAYTSYTGQYIPTKVHIEDFNIYREGLENGNKVIYYVYDQFFNFQGNDEIVYPSIKISWENERIYDSYGLDFVELNPNNDFIEIQPEFDFVYIDYYAGVLSEKDFEENLVNKINDENLMRAYNGSNDVEFKLRSGTTDVIVILLSYRDSCEYEFLDERGYNIYEFFEEPNINGFTIKNNFYYLYYYKVLYEAVSDKDEIINSLKIKINKKEV